MAKEKDDLEAIRSIVETLQGFEAKEQERIIRWSREKLGLSVSTASAPAQQLVGQQQIQPPQIPETIDIKTFVSRKNPSTDKQFAATVAYYYRFVAPQEQRKDCISADDLQDACRRVGRHRLKKPNQTLINTHHSGLLDKGSETGMYSLNTVGENLVAMTLPTSEKTPKIKRKKTKHQKASKKASKKKRKTRKS
jgi:hypothetical protein